jgi:hypothetical protein
MLIAGALLSGESKEAAAAAQAIRERNLMPLDSMEA